MAIYDFDMIVIGGGAAGLTASGIAANFGAKTLMVEKERLGGDCTWTGCIPSKTLLKTAKVIRQIRQGSAFGLEDQEIDFDFSKVMKHVHRTREEVYHDADRPEIFEDMGITVKHGKAVFKDDHTIEITDKDGNSEDVSSKFFLIATGGRAFLPPIPGLNDAPYLTNETLFELEELPEKLIIIGGGPIGSEMSQAFQSLGSEVTVIDSGTTILHRDDPEISSVLLKKLKKEGVRFIFDAHITRINHENDMISIDYEKEGSKHSVEGNTLLMATGRTANVSGLGLENAGIKYTVKGVSVNDSCRTNIPHIYASGDVTGIYQFTHMSEHMSKVAMTRALLKFPMKIDRGHVPSVTFTQPEVGQLGPTEAQLKADGVKFTVYRFPYSKIDRALAENESEGMIKIMAKKWSGKILGVSVVGAHAGEMISEYALAMKNGVSLRNMADTIHPYPSWGLGARRAADQWYIKNQSATTVKWIKRIFRYRGEIPDYSDPDRIV